MQLLLVYGADLVAPDLHGHVPIDLTSNQEILDTLRDQMPADYRGRTSLDLALRRAAGLAAARRGSAEHLTATKALRCTATAWMLIAAESFAKF